MSNLEQIANVENALAFLESLEASPIEYKEIYGDLNRKDYENFFKHVAYLLRTEKRAEILILTGDVLKEKKAYKAAGNLLLNALKEETSPETHSNAHYSYGNLIFSINRDGKSVKDYLPLKKIPFELTSEGFHIPGKYNETNKNYSFLGLEKGKEDAFGCFHYFLEENPHVAKDCPFLKFLQ